MVSLSIELRRSLISDLLAGYSNSSNDDKLVAEPIVITIPIGTGPSITGTVRAKQSLVNITNKP